jgi:hypothetical protein
MSTPFVLKLEYGAGLSDQDRQVLEQAAQDVRQFKPRHDLILEDDSPENAHVIVAGLPAATNVCQMEVARLWPTLFQETAVPCTNQS